MNRRQWLSFLTLLVLSTSACVEPAEPATPQLTPTPARTQVAVPILVTETLLYEAGGAVEAGAEEGISPPKPRKPREYIKEDVDSPTLAENLPTNTPDTRLLPKYWAEWPLIPQVSERAKEIYRLGQEMGNDVRSFSTIGDCQSEPSVFMGVYDSGNYSLDEEYAYLEETIRQFQGSFQRDSITVKDGMSVASVLSPMWADPELCLADESPLECELRLHRPIIMFVNLGTNWNGGNDATHEKYMRQIVDILIAHGVVRSCRQRAITRMANRGSTRALPASLTIMTFPCGTSGYLCATCQEKGSTAPVKGAIYPPRRGGGAPLPACLPWMRYGEN
jgi:hypothetical protein